MIGKLEFKHHKEGWLLEAAANYSEAVTGLAPSNLGHCDLRWRGLLDFREYLTRNTLHLDGFAVACGGGAEEQSRAGPGIRYGVILCKGSAVRVRKYGAESITARRWRGPSRNSSRAQRKITA